ncbi:MAG: 4'-phosphopantetheinyl transferase superfamily protein [Actinomycetota bacterium]|nr:4'-phosphopantetheinyl transferase superfamily protein [Actinomycetota bacterium]
MPELTGGDPAGRLEPVPGVMWSLPAGGCLVLWARPSEDPRLLSLLDEDAHARHAALRRPADRARSATAHALTRLALGSMLGMAPTALRFTRRCVHCGGPHGAPRLDPPGPPLSVSHSGDRVVVALADRPVGVDVEQVVSRDLVGVMAQALTAAERTGVHDPRELLTLWTRKEAALKATGHGLAASLHDLVVTAAGEPAGVVTWTGVAAPPGPVHLRDLSPGAGHVGCVALLGGEPPVLDERDADDLLAAV